MSNMKRVVVTSLLVSTVFGLGTTSCTPSAASGSSYGAAFAAAAVLVAAVGVHRARTGDCWGHCGPGLACDAKSGLCLSGQCEPACGNGETCQLLSVGPTCGPDPAQGLQIAGVKPNAGPLR